LGRSKINIYLALSLISMAVIFYLSLCEIDIRTPGFSSGDKLLHMLAYGVLACLIYMALKEAGVARSRALALAFASSFAYGLCNETLQYFLPWREADVLDMTANGVGAFFFPLVLWYRGY